MAEQEYEKEKLNERIAKLSGGVAVIQVLLGFRHENPLKSLFALPVCSHGSPFLCRSELRQRPS